MHINPNEVKITQIVDRLVDLNGRGVPGVQVYFRVRDQPEQHVTLTREDFTPENVKRLVTEQALKILETLDLFK